jgi:hypothetical protein
VTCRQAAAELSADRTVTLPGAFNARLRVVPRDRGHAGRVPMHPLVLAVARRQDVQQPGDFPDD